QELQRLLSALCDTHVSEADHVRLEELLDRDQECRRMYLEYVDMHARLLGQSGSGATPELQNNKAAAVPGSVRQGLRYLLVATTTLAASLLVQLYLWRSPEGGPVRPLQPAPDRPLPRY